jgi:hypothetical protein
MDSVLIAGIVLLRAVQIKCRQPFGEGMTQAEAGPITSNATLLAFASPDNFHNKASAGDLSTISAAIATDIGQGSTGSSTTASDLPQQRCAMIAA